MAGGHLAAARIKVLPPRGRPVICLPASPLSMPTSHRDLSPHLPSVLLHPASPRPQPPPPLTPSTPPTLLTAPPPLQMHDPNNLMRTSGYVSVQHAVDRGMLAAFYTPEPILSMRHLRNRLEAARPLMNQRGAAGKGLARGASLLGCDRPGCLAGWAADHKPGCAIRSGQAAGARSRQNS